MRNDINELKKAVSYLMSKDRGQTPKELVYVPEVPVIEPLTNKEPSQNYYQEPEIKAEEPAVIEENLSLAEKEKELIIKALEKHGGKRKPAAKELGISERTLYRKIKEYNIKI
jgi:DNA-binding NtrC family response regulator